jgi:hypothetical protein
VAKRRHSSGTSEKIEGEKRRRERGTGRSEKENIETRKQAIADGLSKTRERAERVLKKMADIAPKKK